MTEDDCVRLGCEIVEKLALDDWDEKREAALAHDLARVAWAIHAFLSDAQIQTSAKLTAEREQAQTNVRIYRAAAEAIRADPLRSTRGLMGIQKFVIDALRTPSPTDLHDLTSDLDALALAEQQTADRITAALSERKDSRKRAVVEWAAEVLARHGVRPTAYETNEDGLTTGALTIACAMLNGDEPTKAFWVVNLAKEQREARPAVPSSLPNPWPKRHRRSTKSVGRKRTSVAKR